jgi:hypothetical protein
MNSIYYNDDDNVLHKIQRNGGPAITELSYEDEDGDLHRFTIPTVQNIQFSQKRTVTSRNTIRGESRSQFGNISPASISFDIKMNENLFNGLEELIVGNEIVVRRLTTEEATQVAESDTVDISEFVEGNGTSFTIEQFIQALEYIKNNNRIFTLTTSSPLDTYLDNLAMTNLSLSHDKDSREIVNCSIQAKIVKFSDIGWDIIDSTELAGLSFTSEATDDTDTTLWYDSVQTDGQIRFNDNILSSGARILTKTIGPENSFGVLFRKYIEDYEKKSSNLHEDHADYIEDTDVISLTMPGTSTIGFRFWSAYYGNYDESVDANGDPLWYTVSFPTINVEVTQHDNVEWKPQFNFTGVPLFTDVDPDNDISLVSSLYNVWYQYEMDITNSVTEYIKKKEVLSEVRSGNKDWFSHTDPEPSLRSGNYQVSQDAVSSHVWARNLADMYSVKVYANINGGKQLIASVPVSGDYEFFIGRLNIHPDFDADFTGRGKENRTEDVKDAWGFSDPTTKVNVFIAGWMLGGYMKIFAFSRDMLGNQRKIVNTAGA